MESLNKVPEHFLNAIKSSSPDGEEGSLLTKRVLDDSKIIFPSSRRIGLLGRSGAGKSSLINSILGKEVAMIGSSGGACTPFPIEYHPLRHNQVQAFQAEVEYLTKSEGTKMVKGWARNAYQYLDSKENKASDQDKGGDDQGFEKDKLGSTALNSLLTVFGHHAEFATEKSAKVFLKSQKSGDDQALRKIITEWVSSIYQQLMSDKNPRSLYASDSENLANQLQSLIAYGRSCECKDQAGKYWPFVHVVRVSFDSKILQEGLSDINMTRTNATKAYLGKCDKLIVVGKIDRIVDDEEVQRYLITAHHHLSRTKRGVMCVPTATDDFCAGTNFAFDMKLNDDQVVELKLADIQIQYLTDKHTEMLTSLQPGKLHRRELKLHKDRLKKVQSQIAKAKLSKEEYQITIRNDRVVSELIAKYARLANGQDLLVFPVSNRIYAEYLKALWERNSPVKLTPTGTGVPALRKFLYGIASAGKFEALNHQCFVLGNLIRTCELSSSLSKIKKQERLEVLVKESKEKSLAELHDRFKLLRENEVSGLCKVMKTEDSAMRACAQALLDTWAKLKAPTHAAWCRHWGAWKLDGDQKDWNVYLQEPIKKVLETQFDTLESACLDGSDFLGSTLSQILIGYDGMIQQIRNHPSTVMKESLARFLYNTEQREAGIHNMIDSTLNVLRHSLETIEQRTFLSSADSYFTEFINPIYEECQNAYATPGVKKSPKGAKVVVKEVKAKNKHQVRCEILTSRICSHNTLYHHICTKRLQPALQAAVQTAEETMKTKIESLYADIYQDLQFIFEKDDDNDPETIKLRQAVRDVLGVASSDLDNAVAFLKECKP
ncbi:hypothetical protein EJ05DRAFT_160774 [Pseudovirgaria hyperparasitica]|uniref:Uncharacterized protein n=1 Tax=Pseudovirgaria hyperparasitica TaxID=470096 RepID=A0A6A6VVQ8_9PEZI|nr:uncharacterized protein EJ05DRAFT_160774 [Pseudovirgaria hyperparasitica]KAF2753949.1 hypothetical protein EJ05DRAFT_160774 [Pseudovirgaria hyperparasitica]